MTIDNLINWLQEAEDNNTWLVSTQSVKRHLEKIKETEQLTLTDVVHRRELLLCVCTEVHGTVRNSENELVCEDCYEPIKAL